MDRRWVKNNRDPENIVLVKRLQIPPQPVLHIIAKNEQVWRSGEAAREAFLQRCRFLPCRGHRRRRFVRL